MSFMKPVCGNMLRFSRVIGTGGIGSGISFMLEGEQTLGRNESRQGILLPSRDYCKQHIILHYLSVLLGNDNFRTYPIGRVGKDSAGKALIDELTAVGMDISAVTVDSERSTLFSVCFQYPDYSGGNITSSNGASGYVSERDIHSFFATFQAPDGRELILAAPEVPLASRLALLSHGKRRGAFNAAAILAQEAEEFLFLKGVESVDLLALNISEASSLAGLCGADKITENIVFACYKKLQQQNPHISLIITNGANGCYGVDKNGTGFVPALKIQAVSTAGAGDALLSGTLAGLACGLPLYKEHKDTVFSETPLSSALELGALLASLSITSPHTICPSVSACSLAAWAQRNCTVLSEEFVSTLNNTD